MNEIPPELLEMAKTDPALMQQLQEQMAQAAMLGREQDAAQNAMNRHAQGYGTNTGQTFVGDPLGAALGGFQAGKGAMSMPDIIRRGKEAAGTYGKAVAGMPYSGPAMPTNEMPMTAEEARIKALRAREGY